MSSLTLPKNSPLVLSVLSGISSNYGISTNTGPALNFCDANGASYKTPSSVIKAIMNNVRSCEPLYGPSDKYYDNIISWVSFIFNDNVAERCELEALITKINNCLQKGQYLSGDYFCLSDICAISFLEKSRQFQNYKKDESLQNWIDSCIKQECFKGISFVNIRPSETICNFEQGGRFLELPGAEMGKVVVRFPPEASGYLHIGHAKAALLNQFYKDKYNGKFIMRFDDTNPQKETLHFEKVILEDVKLLGVTFDIFSRTSDHFDKLIEYAEKLIKIGLAYCDNTPQNDLREMRTQKSPSKFRDSTVEANMEIWSHMKNGDQNYLEYCLRAKIDYLSDNGALRDPIMYRSILEPHATRGNKYKVYPTYDFACPIVDSIEGVTHALRTSEYRDRDPQYDWFLTSLELRKPIIYEYSRLNLQYTVLSKRKLTKLVDAKVVEGWEDPRMPTVRGFLRRGLSLVGLKEFILAQGFSRSVVTMETDKLWAFNRKAVETDAPRYTAIDINDVCLVTISEKIPMDSISVDLIPKKQNSTMKTVYCSNKLFIEQIDAKTLNVGDPVTLLNWGNTKVSNIVKSDKVQSLVFSLDLENKDFGKTAKLTWLSDLNDPNIKPIPLQLHYYKSLFTKAVFSPNDNFEEFINYNSKTVVKALGESCLKDVKKGQIIQLLRKGLFICDSPYDSKTNADCILIEIPSGNSGDLIKGSEKPISSDSGANDKPKNNKAKSSNGKEKAVKTPQLVEATSQGAQKKTLLGLTVKKDEDFPEWYSQTLCKSEMLEYYDISGCYILRPLAYSIWEAIQKFFDAEIKKMGVENCYFPMFVTQSALKKEANHITDFAPEVAWVTKSGDTDLAEPIAIRPTSETVMYPYFAKWVQSHRDLPIKLNQWCNVVRWEFKHPTPFLRTREFLWQEGHTAFATREEATKEVYDILELYSRVYIEYLAIPVIKGRKTEAEKFAGADFTTTVEAFIATSGRGCQGATSHHLSQNFSKMFDIVFEDPTTKEKTHVHQNSWGISTRTIGALVMIHGDNKGLILPPKVAPIQVVIVPCGLSANATDIDKSNLYENCQKVLKLLQEKGIRAHLDIRDHVTPGWKFNSWELKGVPLRVEIGPKDMEKKSVLFVRRDTSEKLSIGSDICAETAEKLLLNIQMSMFNKAKKELDENLVDCSKWVDFLDQLNKRKIIRAPFCGEKSCEETIKKDSASQIEESDGKGDIRTVVLMGAKSLCIPMEQSRPMTSTDCCIRPECKNNPKYFVIFGRSY